MAQQQDLPGISGQPPGRCNESTILSRLFEAETMITIMEARMSEESGTWNGRIAWFDVAVLAVRIDNPVSPRHGDIMVFQRATIIWSYTPNGRYSR